MTSNGAYSASVASSSFPPFPNLLLIHPTRKKKKEKFCYLVVVVDILASNVYFFWPALEAIELNPLAGMIFHRVEFQIPVHLTATTTTTLCLLQLKGSCDVVAAVKLGFKFTKTAETFVWPAGQRRREKSKRNLCFGWEK
jgi:hypothetical protein